MQTSHSKTNNTKAWVSVVKIYIVLMLVGGLSVVVSRFTGISLCLFYSITGIPFFSCGIGRAFESLPNIRQALFYHPLFFTIPLIPFLAFLSPKTRNIASAILIALFVVVWIIRMILMFPHTAPMNYNCSSLVEFILRRLRDGGEGSYVTSCIGAC